jgi:sulfate adenylyltransferase large subunit
MAATTSAHAGDAFAGFLEENLQKELLRFTTAGSVDDGKSTLIGHLLHDAKAVYEDQLAAVKKSRINRSGGPVDFSLITDGLRAEREQGITIDVGYRYFATSRRKFIIADTPGHEQYTRNMATGASTADLAVILLDATKGLLPQTFRHTFIAALLGIRHVLAAVNKMDLVEYRQEVFAELQQKMRRLTAELGVSELQCIPVSALLGDNIVHRSERMPWHTGPTILEHLESVPVRATAASQELRLPVQMVLRPDSTFRGFAGRLAGGTVRAGDVVKVLPSGRTSRVKRLVSYEGEQQEAVPGESVTLELADEIDVSRGDLIVSPKQGPTISRHFSAMVVWLQEPPLKPGAEFLLKHMTRHVRGKAVRIVHRVDVNTLAKEPAAVLKMNDVALVEFSANSPLYFDPYLKNRATGSFILIDPMSNATAGAGMIEGDLSARDQRTVANRAVDRLRNTRPVSLSDRVLRHGHSSLLLIYRGSREFGVRTERALFEEGLEVFHLAAKADLATSRVSVVQALLEAGLIVLAPEEDLHDLAIEELRAASIASVGELREADSFADEQEQLKRVLEEVRRSATSEKGIASHREGLYES